MARSGTRWLVALPGSLGRALLGTAPAGLSMLGSVGSAFHLLLETLYFSFVAPLRGETKLRRQLFPMMANVGARSLPIVALVSMLIGSVLVLQTGHVLEQYGQIQEVPGLVAVSMTRELGPLMTAIVLIGRVGASFTAVLGSMKINEEITALRTMAINPVGYLVAPRFLSMVVMMPCLVVFSFLLGMTGGAVVASSLYDIPRSLYIDKTLFYLQMGDILGGLLKAVCFGVLVSVVSCYYGMATTGGSTGLGRNIMVSVVSCIVTVVLADALLTAVLVGV